MTDAKPRREKGTGGHGEASEPCAFTWREHVCALPKGNHFIHMDANGYRWL